MTPARPPTRCSSCYRTPRVSSPWRRLATPNWREVSAGCEAPLPKNLNADFGAIDLVDDRAEVKLEILVGILGQQAAADAEGPFFGRAADQRGQQRPRRLKGALVVQREVGRERQIQ